MRVDVWEKGNVGITDLSSKLHLCLKQALCDYILELFFLPQPIATANEIDDPESPPSSPFVVLEPSPELTREDSIDSPRRLLFEKGEVRIPTSLGVFSAQRSQESGSVSSPLDTPVQAHPHRSRCDTVSVTAAMDDVFSSLEGGGHERDDDSATTPVDQSEVASVTGLTWQEKEMNRREIEALDAYQREAHHGHRGILEETYHSLIPQHFTETCQLSSHSVEHHTFPLLGSYSAEVFLNESLNILGQVCSDFSLGVFKLGQNGLYSHYTPLKTSRPRSLEDLEETGFFVVGRNLKQWDEARTPNVQEIRLTQVHV